MQNWVLTTGCDGVYGPIRDLTWPNQEEYAHRYDFQFIPWSWRNRDGAGSIQVSWSRIDDMLHALNEGYSGVVCVDTDAVFLPGAPDIVEEFLHCRTFSGDICPDVLMAAQSLGPDKHVFPSAGVVMVRNTGPGRRWLEQIRESRHSAAFKHDPWCEQAVMYQLIGFDWTIKGPGPHPPFRAHTSWAGHVGLLPHWWHSTPPDPCPYPCYLYHATGGTSKGVPERVTELKGILEHAIV